MLTLGLLAKVKATKKGQAVRPYMIFLFPHPPPQMETLIL